MIALVLLAALASADVPASEPALHFEVSASFQQTKAGPEIAVTFTPRNPDVHINQNPGPRLKLTSDQKVLVEKSVRRDETAKTPGTYLDTAWPVVFPVALVSGAPKGAHSVHGTVTYYYCSKRDGWCRKGTADVDVPVTLP